MTITVTISDHAEKLLRAEAARHGQPVATVAKSLLEATLSQRHLDEVLRPVRDAFEASGMTEDEASELFEREKHAMRAERRAQREAGP